ncbi:MAG: carbon-nitrogen hydrolase [Acidiferrobacterales bacterium]
MSPNKNSLVVATVQQTCCDDTQSNLEITRAAIVDAAEQGAQLVLLQELHSNIYFCQSKDRNHFDLAEPIPGPTTDTLAQFARENRIVIIGSVFERCATRIYHNTAVVLDSDGSLAGQYRKMHIPDDPGYYEKFYFTPGDQGFRPIDTSVGKLGVLVCWDQWYPEAARLMALHGADLLLYPTAIGWDPRDDVDEKQRQLESWLVIQRSHAIANSLPLMCANRCGLETSPGEQSDGIDFWGSSFIAGPQGEVIASASANSAETLVAQLDMTRTEKVRRVWPFFRDRRIDAYDDLVRVYNENK